MVTPVKFVVTKKKKKVHSLKRKEKKKLLVDSILALDTRFLSPGRKRIRP
jgi:hypothetical protein